MSNLAFAAPAAPLSGVSSLAGAPCTASITRSRVFPRGPARRASVVRRSAPVAQYNYNIYQDNKDRSRRDVSAQERSVTVKKPLGLVLEEGQDGMVFIASIDPQGNAAEEEDIQEGDVIVAVSATFGDDVWSTRGVGLDRVMKSIRVRGGDFVTLVLESPDVLSSKKTASAAEAQQKRVVARETRGEREVLNPVTWGAAKPDLYEDGDPAQAEISEELKARLKNEIVQPYEQSWILWISLGIGALALLLTVSGISG